MQLIDGKKLASDIRQATIQDIQKSKLTPGLAVMLVGDDPASALYVSLKEKAARDLGVLVQVARYPALTHDSELIAQLAQWNADPAVHGILVQLPLPEGHDVTAVITAVAPAKDVDCFHPESVRKLLDNEAEILSPVHEGIMRLIASTGITINQAKTVVIANSNVFAEPLVYLLKRAGAFVTNFTPETLEKDVVQAADIIVIAIGRAKFLTRDFVKSGAVVIDVGTNRQADGKVVGDADADNMKDIPGWITPVPGGVGPMTIALLLKNVVELAKRTPNKI